MRVWFLLFFIALLGVSAADDKVTIEAMLTKFKEGLGEVPDIDAMIKMVELFTAKMVTYNNRVIGKGFDEIRSQVYKSNSFPNDLSEREVAGEASALMGYLSDISSAETAGAVEFRIKLFLNQSRKIDPYHEISFLSPRIPLKTQIIGDVYRSKTRLEATRRTLYSVLNELALAYLFQLYLDGDQKDRQKNIVKLKETIEEKRNEANEAIEDLLKTVFWPNMDKMVSDAMTDNAKSKLVAKSDAISSFLFDIQTNNRFCFIVSTKRRYMPDVIVGASITTRDQLAYFNKKYVVVILRITKGNTVSIAEIQNKFETFQKANDKCYSQDQAKLGEYAMNNNVFIIGSAGKEFGPETVMTCNGENPYTSISTTCSYGSGLDRRRKDVTYHLIPHQY